MSPTADAERLFAVILAAGCSRRLGHPKQLLPWQGQTLLESTIKKAQSVCHDDCLVVLGSHAEIIQTTINLQTVHVVENRQWSEGIASSIRAGIEALPYGAQAALFLLCDQPLIDSVQLATLTTTWQRHPQRIVASGYHDQVGVPAVFPRRYFHELLALRGDQGAKRLLKQFATSVMNISLPKAFYDIDNEADYQSVLSVEGQLR